MKYYHVGLLCLAIPAMLAFSTYSVANYMATRASVHRGQLDSKKLRQFIDPWLTVTVTAIGAIFYLTLVFAPPGEFQTPRIQFALLITLVLAYSLRAIATHFRHKEKLTLEKTWRKTQTGVLLVLLGWIAYMNESNLLEVFWPVVTPGFGVVVLIGFLVCAYYGPLHDLRRQLCLRIANAFQKMQGGVGPSLGRLLRLRWVQISLRGSEIALILTALFLALRWRGCLASLTTVPFLDLRSRGVWYLALPMLVGFLMSSVRRRVSNMPAGEGSGYWDALGTCVYSLIFFFVIMVFGYSVYHYIPAAKGGGDFTDARLVSISLKQDSKVQLPDWLFSRTKKDDSKALVLIEGATNSIFVADPGEQGGPSNWRRSRACRPRIAEIPRSEIGSLNYLDETFASWERKHPISAATSSGSLMATSTATPPSPATPPTQTSTSPPPPSKSSSAPTTRLPKP